MRILLQGTSTICNCLGNSKIKKKSRLKSRLKLAELCKCAFFLFCVLTGYSRKLPRPCHIFLSIYFSVPKIMYIYSCFCLILRFTDQFYLILLSISHTIFSSNETEGIISVSFHLPRHISFMFFENKKKPLSSLH